MFVNARARSHEETKSRLLTAAAELFAARGFHGTKVRDIAARAGVNVAAGHYHFGSKKNLYLEVLRELFARIRHEIEATGAALAPGALQRATIDELLRLLRARLGVMVRMIVGQEPNLHSQLMMREMADPSEALPVIVQEFIAPLVREMREIIARLRPELDARQVERVTFSIAGQVHFYRFMMPVLLPMLDLKAYSKPFLRQIEDHILDFSLGGMEKLAARERRARA
jgi:AcrR family transcriptional regulator